MKYLASDKIDQRAIEILEKYNALTIPVPVNKVATLMELDLSFVALGEDISGLLVVENGKGFIGINESHSRVRQRFTIAHEIGHYVLHQTNSSLFIDKRYNAFRNAKSSTGEDRAEIQANIFAASLLMPKSLLENHISAKSFDLGSKSFGLDDDSILLEIAKDFEVSLEALVYRLARLDTFSKDSFR